MKVQRRGRFRLFTWLVALAAGGAHGAGCGVERDDRFVVLRRIAERVPGAPTSLIHPAPDDSGATRVRRLMSDGFAGELLRTLAMTRRLVGTGAPPADVTRPRGSTPVYLALGISDRDSAPATDARAPTRPRPSHGDRVIGTGWLREPIPEDAPIVWIDDDPTHVGLGRAPTSPHVDAGGDQSLADALALEQIVTGLGEAVVDLVAPDEAAGAAREPPHSLRDGYVKFLEVIAAEWGSPRDDGVSADARAWLRRGEAFAAVRANDGLARFRDHRPGEAELDLQYRVAAGALVRDPTVIAATLYRMASSPVGRRLARDDVYRPFIQTPPPTGISPGRLLGAFRNFQAKLLSAWTAAVQARRAPRDLIDLIEVYAAAYPEERAQVTRIFLVTTAGLTARPGGVDERQSADQVASKLAGLTADVLCGRRDLRTALRSPRPAGFDGDDP